jgi:hypothetical protein
MASPQKVDGEAIMPSLLRIVAQCLAPRHRPWLFFLSHFANGIIKGQRCVDEPITLSLRERPPNIVC